VRHSACCCLFAGFCGWWCRFLRQVHSPAGFNRWSYSLLC
jgi:hypothetical protein